MSRLVTLNRFLFYFVFVMVIGMFFYSCTTVSASASLISPSPNNCLLSQVEWNSRLQKKLMFNFEGWISYNIIMEHVQIRVFKKKNCGHAVMIFADGGTQKTIKQNTDLYSLCSLCWCCRLVLEWCERKTLMAGW